jgi:UPF0755 protein
MWKYGVALFVSLLLLPGAFCYCRLPHDFQSRDSVELVLEGENLRQVACRLAEKELLRFPRLFMVLARVLEKDRTVQAGEYLLNSSMCPREILERLSCGATVLYRITVPEGYSVKQIASLLEQTQLADGSAVLQASRDLPLLEELGVRADSLEGYLFPDTYYFAKGHSPQTLLKTMVRQFWKSYDSSLRDPQHASGWNLCEVVTMASIVEAEARKKEEKPLIASVLIYRLRKGMPLQCDPTVIYGLENFEGNLKREHLLVQHPYNTYEFKGLPPGPICNPGLDSLKAVLDPADTSYLYFVSRNDGTHEFSTTLRDHNRAVQNYQKKGSARSPCRP